MCRGVAIEGTLFFSCMINSSSPCSPIERKDVVPGMQAGFKLRAAESYILFVKSFVFCIPGVIVLTTHGIIAHVSLIIDNHY
jgi:hypothetical protein